MRHETILIVESEELQHTTVEIDKLSNTVIYTTDTSATANTLLLDKILTLQDSKQEFNALVAEDIAQELIGGFNSSVISIKAASVIGQSDDLLNAIVGLLTQRNSGDEVPSLAISVYEIYGDAFRDLIDPNAALVLTSTYKGDVLDGLTTVPIATPFDLLNVLTRVHGSMSSDIDKTWNIYEIFVLQAEVESTLRIVETCSPRYSAMEKSKLILSEGMLMAESMVSFYEILNNPAAVYSTNLTVARLLEREVGGNTSVRWIAGLSESELESSVCLWLFRMLEMARQVDNIPVTNTRFVIENQKRIWFKMTKGNKSNSNGGSNNSTRNKQREVDLTNRINTLIKTNTETTITVQQYKKQVLEEKKKTIDTKIQMSKLRDEVLGLNEKIQGFYDKERRSHFSTSEKIGMEKMMGDLNVKLESKIKELEFHILQLLSGREQWEEIKIKLEGEVEMLKRHNTYLEEISAIKSGNANLLPAAFKTQELVEAKLPRPTDSNPMNLFEKLQQVIHEYQKRTQRQLDKCREMISPTDYADLVVGLTNFIDSEYHLLAQIQHMKEHSDSDPPSGDLRRELAFFMNETQLRLEREKYSLLAKCSALEEEIL